VLHFVSRGFRARDVLARLPFDRHRPERRRRRSLVGKRGAKRDGSATGPLAMGSTRAIERREMTRSNRIESSKERRKEEIKLERNLTRFRVVERVP